MISCGGINLRIDDNKVLESVESMQQEYEWFNQVKAHLTPRKKAILIACSYLIIGCLWILLSDKILAFMVQDVVLYSDIQMIKGWVYVFLTATLLFFMIYMALKRYSKLVDAILNNYEELMATYQEMVAMNEELDSQNKQLEEQKQALQLSEQRYQLVVAGSYDDIWDYDFETDVYLISEERKAALGYTSEELKDTLESWYQIIHPDDLADSKAAFNNYISLQEGIYESIYRIREKTGNFRWVLSRGKGVFSDTGKPLRIAGSHTDITERKYLEARLETLAYYDALTDLPNKILFQKQVEVAMEYGKRMAIVDFDIDDLKHINDLYGQQIGDHYIQYVARILQSHFIGEYFVARVSGDQFMIAFLSDANENIVIDQLELLLADLRKSWDVSGEQIQVTASCGISFYPDHGETFQALMQNAEIAMFYQKEHGKNGYTFFKKSMYEDALKMIQMNTQLRNAVKKEEFILYYQAQYNLKTGKLVGAEALIRWQHPQRGFISPMEFIPLSEETGHIVPISIWVLKKAISQKRVWVDKGFKPLKIAVNMSGYVITDDEIVDLLCKMFDEIDLGPNEIEIEITETAVMRNLEKANENLLRLRAYGITIAMDDFGAGYSSLTYLHKLPIDILKIDREFIRNIHKEDEDSYIYKTVIDLAHNMNLVIVAEGIETKEQKDFLLKNNCDMGQGFYFAKPLPVEEFEKLLMRKED